MLTWKCCQNSIPAAFFWARKSRPWSLLSSAGFARAPLSEWQAGRARTQTKVYMCTSAVLMHGTRPAGVKRLRGMDLVRPSIGEMHASDAHVPWAHLPTGRMASRRAGAFRRIYQGCHVEGHGRERRDPTLRPRPPTCASSPLAPKVFNKTLREVANLPKVLGWDSSKLRSWHVVACHVLVNFRRVQAKYQKPTRELKFIECHLAIYQFVFEHNSQADLVSSSFMEIFCRFTSLLASWCLILQGKIFTSFLVISHTPANFLSLMEADARRAIDSTGSITLWEPRGCTKKARCRVGATSSSSCSWCSSRDLCLGVECLPCGLRFWEHTLLRVHFLRVYIFENTLLRVCFESSRVEGGRLEVE